MDSVPKNQNTVIVASGTGPSPALAVEALPPVEAFALLLEQVFPDVATPLEFLGGVDPELRGLLVERLGLVETGPGVVRFLHVLIRGYDPRLRLAALGALGKHNSEIPEVAEAWFDLATYQVNEATSLAAKRAISGGSHDLAMQWRVPALRPAVQPVRGLVTAMDGTGRALMGLLAEGGGKWVGAVFDCDVELGVVQVGGVEGPERLGALGYLEDRLLNSSRDLCDGTAGLAVELLRAALTQVGPSSPPALGYWVERVCGKGVTPARLRSPAPLRPGGHDSPRIMADHAVELLDALPGWWEDDPLTESLASEAVLRVADPGDDPGAIRILFERRLVHRLERYRRMLTWMGVYWYASKEPMFSQLAFEFAAQLDDPQNAVPRHPWIAEYARRSLRLAGERQVNAARVASGLSAYKRPEG